MRVEIISYRFSPFSDNAWTDRRNVEAASDTNFVFSGEILKLFRREKRFLYMNVKRHKPR